VEPRKEEEEEEKYEYKIFPYNYLPDILANQFKKTIDGTCSTNGQMRNEYKVLLGRSEGKRPLQRPSHGWE
jgi:hypothetical protein